jgi:hypothetical protein
MMSLTMHCRLLGKHETSLVFYVAVFIEDQSWLLLYVDYTV